ncbi:hypothetical protein GCM10007028_11440 [Algibacter mikhailovii]|uniref:Uncharacterized protein n=1 Tax=Algibacter mikhailovii TaxID=425498 RepID=A0A918QXS3_9FLAO|nr:hypothetical protein GCM10007028_11440 [Algibacter mikhailovii]
MHTLYIFLPLLYAILTSRILNNHLTVKIAYKVAKIDVFHDLEALYLCTVER